jgi:hypothetical protein
MGTTFQNTVAPYQELASGDPDGTNVGRSSAELVGFYGYARAAQRAYSSAVHATSALATSTDFGATQLAALQEIQKTLIGLGIWATA